MERPRKLALLALSVLAGLYTLAFAVVVVARFAYPFELEWEEGYSLQQVARLSAGRSLYVAPSLEFIPFPYPPLYFQVCAWASAWLGEGFVPLRLVSAFASLGIGVVLWRWVARETSSRTAGWIAAGLFLATFRAGGAWLDVARVDPLFLLLSLLGAYTLHFSRGTPSAVAAGLLFAASFWTKQTAALLAAGSILGSLALDRRRALTAAGVFVATTVALAARAHATTDGWATFYLFELLGDHELYADMVLGFWTRDVLGVGGVSVLPAVALVAGACVLLRRTERPAKALAYASLFLAWSAAAWISRMHSGGYDNVLLPMYCALALGCGTAIGAGRALAWPALGALQFGLLMYAPQRLVPDELDLAAGREFVARLEAAPGEVFVPSHGYLAELAGKRASAHRMGIADVLRSEDQEVRAALIAEITSALAQRRFALIALDVEWPTLDVLDEHYRFAGEVGWEADIFLPRSGVPHRPEYLYVPLGSAH